MPAIVNALTRRELLCGAAAALGLLAVGCSDDDDAGGSGGTTTATAATQQQGGGAPDPFPVTVDGALGSATIESEPKRVIAVGQYRDADAAIALGVVPIAMPDLSGFIEGGISPWALTELGGGPRPELFDSGELPMEHLASLQPDVILATDRSALADEYELLAAIAPTVSYLNGYNKDEWQTTTRRIGAALGRSERAEQLVGEVEAAIVSAAAASPELAGRTFTFGPVTAEGVINTINSTTDASVIFFSQLGMELSPAVLDLPQGSFPGRAVISPERLDLLDADVVVLTFNTLQARQALEANPLFQSIPAVQRGAYVPLELSTALALGFPSALSIPYGLTELVPALRAALAR